MQETSFHRPVWNENKQYVRSAETFCLHRCKDVKVRSSCFLLCVTFPHSPRWTHHGCWVPLEPSRWRLLCVRQTTWTYQVQSDRSDRSTRRWWLQERKSRKYFYLMFYYLELKHILFHYFCLILHNLASATFLYAYPCTGSFPPNSAPSSTGWKPARRPDFCMRAEHHATSFFLQKVCSRTLQTRTNPVRSTSALWEERKKKITYRNKNTQSDNRFTRMKINFNSPPSAKE